MRAVKELVQNKNPEIERKVRAMGANLGQHTHEFHVRENCLWMDERLVIPVPLRKAVVNRIHCFNHGRSNMFDAARDVWFPYIHRSLVAAADGCKECTKADSNEPRAVKFPHPMATKWEDRSDVDYDVEHINHPRKLAEDQLVSIADRGSALVAASKTSEGVKTRQSEAQTPKRPNKRTELLFQRIK